MRFQDSENETPGVGRKIIGQWRVTAKYDKQVVRPYSRMKRTSSFLTTASAMVSNIGIDFFYPKVPHFCNPLPNYQDNNPEPLCEIPEHFGSVVDEDVFNRRVRDLKEELLNCRVIMESFEAGITLDAALKSTEVQDLMDLVNTSPSHMIGYINPKIPPASQKKQRSKSLDIISTEVTFRGRRSSAAIKVLTKLPDNDYMSSEHFCSQISFDLRSRPRIYRAYHKTETSRSTSQSFKSVSESGDPLEDSIDHPVYSSVPQPSKLTSFLRRYGQVENPRDESRDFTTSNFVYPLFSDEEQTAYLLIDDDDTKENNYHLPPSEPHIYNDDDESFNITVYFPPYLLREGLNSGSQKCFFELRVNCDALVADVLIGLREIINRLVSRVPDLPLGLVLSCLWEFYPAIDDVVQNRISSATQPEILIRRPDFSKPSIHTST